MRVSTLSVLAAALALQTPGCLTAQVKLRELPEVARGRAERLRPKQIAALEPFWADLSLDYEDNQKFLDERIAAAADLGDSVVPMLLEKLTPMQNSDAAVDLAGNCRRVLERLDPTSFVDALAELARGNHGTAKSEAIILLGFADDPQSVAVLSDLLGDAKGWHRFHIVRSLRRLRAPGPAPKVVPYLGTDDRGLRKEVLAYLLQAEASAVAPTVIEALSAEGDDRLLGSYIEYFAACVRQDAAATEALLPLLDRERIDWQDTLKLIQALADVSPRRFEPTVRKLYELIDGNDTSSLAVSAAVSLKALGDKNGVSKLKRSLDEKIRRRKREASLYEQRARLLYATGAFDDAADDYEKIIDYAEGAAMTRRAYQGLLKSEARRRKIQNVVKHMRSSGMSPEEFASLAAEDEPFREAMAHDRVQAFLKQLRKSRAPK
ncbi:MAG: hypothetical protein CMJ88_04400 [Planctomycetes bacterium]|nr:hypothetical protein [Planctomycetota bacterium]